MNVPPKGLKMPRDEKTPTTGFKSFFSGRKRGPPSTDSSEGTISQTKKSTKVSEDNMKDIQADLLAEFDEHSDSEEEVIMENFDKTMEKYFHEFKDRIRAQLKSALSKMTARMEELEKRITALESERADRDNEMLKVKSVQNRQAQYIKKDHCRMFGVAENKGEDCRKLVCEILSKKVNVPIIPEDISVAHRVKKSKRQTHRPIIIRFKDRTQRFEILKQRKRLKNSGISIAEDITLDNLNLIREAENSGYFESVWFWNGKVCAKDKADKTKTYELNLHEDFESVRKR